MYSSSYFTLIKTHPERPLPTHRLQLDPVSILELTEDGMAFLWPVEPDREELCEHCSTFRDVSLSTFACEAYRAQNCFPSPSPEMPCQFKPSPSSDCQDLDAYFHDGACMDAGGYFLSLRDFRLAHNLSNEDITVRSLGVLPGISFARVAWVELQEHDLEMATHPHYPKG